MACQCEAVSNVGDAHWRPGRYKESRQAKEPADIIFGLRSAHGPARLRRHMGQPVIRAAQGTGLKIKPEAEG